MSRLNLIAVLTVVAAVSLVVGMTAPVAVAFAAQHENMTMTMDNASSMGNMTGGGNATSMAETESLPSAGETGVCQPCCIGPNPQC